MTGSEKMPEDWVTRREAASLAGVHLNTIRLWESTGRVSTMKADAGIVMIPRAEIEAIIENRRDALLDDRSRIAVLESENRELRERLTAVDLERRELLERVIARMPSEV